MGILAIRIVLFAFIAVLFVALPGAAGGQAQSLCLGEPPTIVGTEGNDTLAGAPGARNVISALGGDDVITGAEGVDVICGGNGNDQLNGGSGDDQLDGGPGDDAMSGGDGDDLIFFHEAPGPVTVNLTASSATGFGTDSLSGIEAAIGSGFDDMLLGDAAANFFDGLDGNDTFAGGLGNDFFDGDAGNDQFDGGPGLDGVTYSFAPRAITANLSRRVASGWGADRFASIEDLTGSRFRDVFTGNAGPNFLFGLAGSDSLKGLGGRDRLFGGPGRDRLDGGPGRDRLNGGAGVDVCLNGEIKRSC